MPGRVRSDLTIIEGPESGSHYYLAFPLFHAAGVTQIIMPFLYDVVVVLGPAQVPQHGKIVAEIMKQVKLRALIGPPIIFDDLVKNHRDAFLANKNGLKAVCYGGGPLTEATGDFLSGEVMVVQMLASTEALYLPAFMPEPHNWRYLEWNTLAGGICMEPVNKDPDLCELTVLRKAGQEHVQYVFEKFPDLQIWRTGDLFRKHPTEELWAFEGRRDDTIVMNNGEKFNPITMEGKIQKHPRITGALVIGDSKDQVALLLEVNDHSGLTIEDIWPAVHDANAEAPKHARIYKHMVLFSQPQKPFSRAGKGTVVRSLTIKQYEEEIAALYRDAKKNRSTRGEKRRLRITKESLTDLIRQEVASQLEREDFSDGEDFFDLGFDSLMATELLENLASELESFLDPGLRDLVTPRLVYENQNVAALCNVLELLVNGDGKMLAQNLQSESESITHMRDMVTKYTQNLPTKTTHHSGVSPTQKELHVAVTGTTGFLGYYLLAVLLADPMVGKITCLNRSPQAEQKFLTQYSSHMGGDNRTRNLKDLSKLDFLQAALGSENLGLCDSDAEMLGNEVDVVIHNAWKVNFNHNLDSFENDHIRGVRNLIDWSLSSPRDIHICFVSSLAALGDWTGKPITESIPEEYTIPAINMGYAQSKYVAERVLATAAREKGLGVSIIRPGQISGPSEVPGPPWNDTDWFPGLLKTSKEIDFLPHSLGDVKDVDWISGDLLARAVVEIIYSRSVTTEKGLKVFHLANPKTTPYAKLLPTIQKYIGNAAVIPYAEWVQKVKNVRTSRETWEKMPSLKIREFFERIGEADRSFISGRFEMKKSWEASKTLREMKSVSPQLLDEWISAWGI